MPAGGAGYSVWHPGLGYSEWIDRRVRLEVRSNTVTALAMLARMKARSTHTAWLPGALSQSFEPGVPFGLPKDTFFTLQRWSFRLPHRGTIAASDHVAKWSIADHAREWSSNQCHPTRCRASSYYTACAGFLSSCFLVQWATGNYFVAPSRQASPYGRRAWWPCMRLCWRRATTDACWCLRCWDPWPRAMSDVWWRLH